MATENCTATATGFASAALMGMYDAVGVGLKSIVFEEMAKNWSLKLSVTTEQTCKV